MSSLPSVSGSGGIGGGPGGGLFRMPNLVSKLSRPSSYNEILPRLYLGDIVTAVSKDEITRLGITDMITIEIKPLQANDLAPCVKRYLYLNVMDHAKQDIISHFETSNEFIESALKVQTNRVYVHCVAGVSRSASLVIAYVMKTRSMTYTEAFDLVSQKRKIVNPNEGFVRQLVLYHRMKYTIDIANIEYRRTVLDAFVFEFRLISLLYYQVPGGKQATGASSSTSTLSATFDRTSLVHMPIQCHRSHPSSKNSVGILFDQYYNKLHLQEVSKYPNVYDPRTAFKCNKCRTTVFYSISIIENRLPSTTAHSETSSNFKSDSKRDCPFIFIEPQPWMSRNVLERDGNLECYKCKRKLGKFDWTSSESCSCALHNSHMNLNLFKIMRKKVDASQL